MQSISSTKKDNAKNSTWDNIAERIILGYSKHLPKWWKEKQQKLLYFSLRRKYNEPLSNEEREYCKSKGIGLQKKKEDEQIEKIKLAKTVQQITLTGWDVIIPCGKDNRKRFIRGEDADEYAKGNNKEQGFIVFSK